MTYAPTDWVDGVTPVDAAHMDKIEAGILAAQDRAEKGAASGYAPLDAGYHLPNGHLPTRLQEIPEACTDLDTLADKTGWYYFTPTTVGRPADQYGYCQSYAYVGALSTTQIAYLHGSYDTFIRVKSGGVGGAWVRLLDASGKSGNLPVRLAATASLNNAPGDNLNNAVESGWYYVSAAGSNLPVAADFAIETIAYSATFCTQFAHGLYNRQSWKRVQNAGAWGAWTQLTDANGNSTLPLLLSGDANLYRVAASTLQTDGHLHAGYDVVARKGNVAGQIQLSDQGAGTRIYFGTALDTNLYRSAAGVLKTDGILNAVGGLQVNGVPVGGSSIPPRLDTVCQTITDWNTAKDNGFYMGSGAANAPIAGVWFYGEVIQHNPSWVTQEVWQFAGNYSHWIRHLESGTWAPWRRQFASQASGKFYTGSMSNDTSYPFAVTFPVPFRAVPMVVASVSYFTLDWANVRVACTDNTTTGFTLYIHNVAGGNAVEVNWIAVEQ